MDEMCDGLKKVRIGKEEIFPSFSRYSRCDLGARAATSGDLGLRVVGDGNGHVGIGFGKANDVAMAVSKAKEKAKKRIIKVHC